MSWVTAFNFITLVTFVIGVPYMLYLEAMSFRVVSEKDKNSISKRQAFAGLLIAIPLAAKIWPLIHDKNQIASIMAAFILAAVIILTTCVVLHLLVQLFLAVNKMLNQ